MKFYDFTAAPNPRRARIFMAEKGIEVESVQVDLMSGANLKPDYTALNPYCTVPTLQLDDGTCLCDNLSIAYYLESVQPEPPLIGTSPVETALILEWTSRIETDGIGAVGEAFRNSNPAFAKRALTGSVGFEAIPALVERGKARTKAFFTFLDEQLQGRDYLVGDRFSLADITALCAVDFAGWIKIGIEDDQTNLKRWHESVSSRPSAKA